MQYKDNIFRQTQQSFKKTIGENLGMRLNIRVKKYSTAGTLTVKAFYKKVALNIG